MHVLTKTFKQKAIEAFARGRKMLLTAAVVLAQFSGGGATKLTTVEQAHGHGVETLCVCDATTSSTWTVMMIVTTLVGAATIGFLLSERRDKTARSAAPTITSMPSKEEKEKKVVARNAQTQSQTTYAHKRKEPRFVPLGDREQGTWTWS